MSRTPKGGWGLQFLITITQFGNTGCDGTLSKGKAWIIDGASHRTFGSLFPKKGHDKSWYEQSRSTHTCLIHIHAVALFKRQEANCPEMTPGISRPGDHNKWKSALVRRTEIITTTTCTMRYSTLALALAASLPTALSFLDTFPLVAWSSHR